MDLYHEPPNTAFAERARLTFQPSKCLMAHSVHGYILHAGMGEKKFHTRNIASDEHTFGSCTATFKADMASKSFFSEIGGSCSFRSLNLGTNCPKNHFNDT